MFSFHLGNVKVTCENINELREYIDEIQPRPGDEFCKHLNDFIYDVESNYQSYHELGPDNWDMVH